MPLDDAPSTKLDLASIHDSDVAILCARCHHGITYARHRIAVDDRHEHVHINPHGVVYRVGCFREAHGAVAVSEATRRWTWFHGYAWQVATCRACGAHLGWRFVGEAATFWGLSLDALRE